jgi:ATP-dependent Clp protease ATP-binding subunit ClpC
MEEARELTASTMCISISTEAVLYFLAKKYIEASGKSDIECDLLLPIFKGLPIDTQNNLLDDLKIEALDYCKRNKYPEPTLYNSENIILSEDLDRAFRRAKVEMTLDISYSRMVSKSEEINSLELLVSVLSEQSYLCDILADYKISKEAILTSYIAKSEAQKIINNVPGNTMEDMFNTLASMFDGLSSGDSRTPNSTPKARTEDEQRQDDEDFEKAGNTSGAISTKKADPDSRTPTLDEFATDMTQAALDGKYDPVVGRDKEIRQITEILCCRKKNNAILLGDPGSGKTAIVELLAQKIASKDVPRELLDKRVLSLSTTDLTSGTIYRGQLEQRVQDLCTELKWNRNIILYIDEFQQATSDSSTSIAQMLKPALGRGEITLIASTTTDEYRKFIEKDGALKRRFSPVQVGEPSVEETIEILKGIAPRYSEFHHVKYEPEVLKVCAEWSGKYINDRFFPDKAISVLDMSFSLAKLKNPSNTDKLEKLKANVLDLQEKKKALTLDLKLDEAEVVRKEEEKATNKLKKEQDLVNRVDPKTWPSLSIAEVSEVISKLSGVPIDKIMSSDMTKLKSIKTTLGEKVIGQDEAIEELTLALQRNVLGLRNPNKPIASFLLVGPTGVGKSYISKILSEEFMGSEKSLITIACSEYMQDWAESKLLGSAPGYVGFSDSEPRLYILKRKPYSVLLIDEVEKSSSNLYNIWLNMLEEGEITLSSGEKVSCRNTIIIFTGNVGTKNLELHGNGLGYGTLGKDEKKKSDLSIVMKEVKKEFRPEFLNRLTKVIVFNSLGSDELGKIFYLELAKLQNRLHENNGYTLKVSDKIKDLIVSKCEPQYGARSLQRLITTYIEDEICKTMLDVDITGKTDIEVDLEPDSEKIKVEFK